MIGNRKVKEVSGIARIHRIGREDQERIEILSRPILPEDEEGQKSCSSTSKKRSRSKGREQFDVEDLLDQIEEKILDSGAEGIVQEQEKALPSYTPVRSTPAEDEERRIKGGRFTMVIGLPEVKETRPWNHWPVVALLDTGADISYMREDLYRVLLGSGAATMLAEHRYFHVAEGAVPLDVLGMSEVTFSIEGEGEYWFGPIKRWMAISPNITTDVILGSDFIRDEVDSIQVRSGTAFLRKVGSVYFGSSEDQKIDKFGSAAKRILRKGFVKKQRCSYEPDYYQISHIEQKKGIDTGEDQLGKINVVEDPRLRLAEKSEESFNGFPQGHSQYSEVGDLILTEFPDLCSHTEAVKIPLEEKEGAGVSRSEEWILKTIIAEFQECFSSKSFPYGKTSLVHHRIHLNGKPARIPARPKMNPAVRNAEREIIDEFLREDIIRPSYSSFSAPTHLVTKKDGGWRLCLDYRELNKFTIRDTYPLPRIEDLIYSLKGANYFALFDLAKGFHQVPVAEGDKHKTAFSVHGRGMFEFNQLPMGLMNAVATCQRFTETMLADMLNIEALVYLDDICVFATTFIEFCQRLRKLLLRVKAAKAKFKSSKCIVGTRCLEYLGHKVSASGILPSLYKTKAIEDFKVPKTKKDLMTFLGLTGYYRRFVPNYSSRVAPLAPLVKAIGPMEIELSPEQEEIFYSLKKFLVTAPVLAMPCFDKPFVLKTDASQYACGAILSQEGEDGLEHPILYDSKKFSEAEQKWCTTEQEAFAIFWAIKKHAVYLEGRPFTIITDHRPLLYIKDRRGMNAKVERWALYLQDFDFKIRHKAGKAHQDVDAMSRLPTCYVSCIETTIQDAFEGEVNPTLPNDEQMLRLQQEDEDIQQIRTYLIVGPEGCNVRWRRKLKNYGKSFRIDEDNHLLYLYSPAKDLPEWKRLVVPGDIKRIVLYLAHDHLLAGHLGRKRTIARISRRYWWNGIINDVNNWVHTCPVCRSFAPPKKASWPMQPIPVTRAFELVGLDLVGPFPKTKEGNTYVAVFVEYLTKWVEVYPLPDVTTATLAPIFGDFVSRHCPPEVLITDQGPQFTSLEWKKLCGQFGIKHRLTSPYHPQTDGLVERFNQTLVRGIRKYITIHRDWDVIIPYFLYAYRITPHGTTGICPFTLLYGREPRLPDEEMMVISDSIVMPSHYLQVMCDTLCELQEEAVRAINRMNNKVQERTKNIPLPYFAPGTVVRMQAGQVPYGLTPKLFPRFANLYRVQKVLNNGLNYIISPLGGDIQIRQTVHVTRLLSAEDISTAWIPSEEIRQVSFDKDGKLKVKKTRKPTAKLQGTDFEISEITDRKMGENGMQYYKVHFKGVPFDRALWIPEEDLRCPKEISKFEIRRRQVEISKIQDSLKEPDSFGEDTEMGLKKLPAMPVLVGSARNPQEKKKLTKKLILDELLNARKFQLPVIPQRREIVQNIQDESMNPNMSLESQGDGY